MTCPFKDNRRLKKMPCSWHTAPGYPNVRICEICQKHYRVDKIVREEYREESFLVLFFIVLIAVILSTVTMSLNPTTSETIKNNTQIESRSPSRF